MEQYNIPIDTYSFKTYIKASILVDILSKIKEIATKERIINALEALKNYNRKGFKLTFDPKTRQLSETIWLDTGKDEWKAIQVNKLTSTEEAQ